MRIQGILHSLIRYGVLIFLVVSSGLALYIIYNGGDFDPVAEVQRLNSEHRRDDALDMVTVFQNNQPEELGELNNELSYSGFEKAKDFTFSGLMLGKVYNVYSGLGALISDLCVYGDIRDIADQGWRHFTKDEEYDQLVLVLSVAGLGLSAVPAFDGIEALAKNIVKYLRNVPAEVSQKVMALLHKAKNSPAYASKLWDILKKNSYSIPRTVSNLSHVANLKHLETAQDLVSNHKRTGNVFINLTGESGINLYSQLPGRFRNRFIEIFKKHPKVVLGLTKTHFYIHTVKIFRKYKLVALLVPVTSAAMLLSSVPKYLVWILFVSSTLYLSYSVTRMFSSTINKPKRKGEQNESVHFDRQHGS